MFLALRGRRRGGVLLFPENWYLKYPRLTPLCEALTIAGICLGIAWVISDIVEFGWI